MIVSEGFLVSDAVMIERGSPATTIGMSSIKQRRLALPVDGHPGDYVGDFVPFYFCSRSVMLYLLYRGNHPELTYKEGQGPIVHLEADLHAVVAWANEENRRWMFTLSNAGARYAPFRSDLSRLDEIDWNAVSANNWRATNVKEGKQAEFLVHDSFPWDLVSRIGVRSMGVKTQVDEALKIVQHRPKIEIKPDWYY